MCKVHALEEPIRVLRVVGRMDRGGLETIIMNCYRITDRTKIQYDFVVHTNDECMYEEEIKQLGGRIYRVPRYRYFNHQEYCKAWERFFEEHKEYKIIHGHIRSTASIYLRIARQYGLTTIAHSHGVSSGTGIKALIKNYLQKDINKYSDYLLACSMEAGKWLFGKDVSGRNNFKVLKNGIDALKFQYDRNVRQEVREELGLQDKKVIGHVGRFDNAKNQIFLVDLIDGMKNEIEDKFVVLLVGNGENFEFITEEIEKRNLKKYFILLGSRNDVHRIMQAMDVFVFPSKFEGFGNVVIEAQASGLPCVISKNVPKDVIVTKLVTQMDLEDEISQWWNEIVKKMNTAKRENCVQYIVDAGYDVNALVEWYEEFYLNCSNKQYKIK